MFDPILGRLPSGIFILTAAHQGQATGILTSWVMQAGFEPPMLTIALNQKRYVCDWITAGAPFVLNVVGEGDKRLLKHFGRGFEPGQPAFEGLGIRETTRGVPLLSEGIGYLECQPVEHIDSADHRIFLARVVDGSYAGEQSPMVHIRKSGKHY